MPQIHLRAELGDYAPLVLLPGDPKRATRIAAMFDGGLDSARKVNEHRALFGYTGTYQGVPVSVQTTGMGTPSFSIVVEELLRLGARGSSAWVPPAASGAASIPVTWSSRPPRHPSTAPPVRTSTAIRSLRSPTSG